jgi:hypothetical protein
MILDRIYKDRYRKWQVNQTFTVSTGGEHAH